MKRLALLALPWALLLGGCGSGEKAAQAAASSGEAFSLAEASAEEGGIPEFKDRASAVAYVRQKMYKCRSPILLRLQSKSPGAEISQICRELQPGEGVTRNLRLNCMGGLMVIIPDYADAALMARAHSEPAFHAHLTAEQKKALAVAERAVAEACSRYSSDYDRAVALHDFVVTRAAYRKSAPNRPHGLTTVSHVLGGKGVCETYAQTYRLLLDMAGISNRYVVGQARGEGHCWNMAKLDGRWVHIDCTYDDPLPDVAGRALHAYFGMADSQISGSHVWNRSQFPSASASSLYYPMRSNRHFKTVQELMAWRGRNHGGLGDAFYVDELFGQRSLAGVKTLLAKSGMAGGVSFSWNPDLPGVIVLKN